VLATRPWVIGSDEQRREKKDGQSTHPKEEGGLCCKEALGGKRVRRGRKWNGTRQGSFVSSTKKSALKRKGLRAGGGGGGKMGENVPGGIGGLTRMNSYWPREGVREGTSLMSRALTKTRNRWVV